jgi:hypothetical protein
MAHPRFSVYLVTDLGCPILAQRGWEAIAALFCPRLFHVERFGSQSEIP